MITAHELMGRAHAAVVAARDGDRGQGTVEYVGLILLLGVVLAGVVSAAGGMEDSGIADTVVGKLKDAIGEVSGEKPKK